MSSEQKMVEQWVAVRLDDGVINYSGTEAEIDGWMDRCHGRNLPPYMRKVRLVESRPTDHDPAAVQRVVEVLRKARQYILVADPLWDEVYNALSALDQPAAKAGEGKIITADRAASDAEIERLRKELAEEKRHSNAAVADAQRAANGLYLAILAKLEPHFPKDDRGLDWDVLPSTISGLVRNLKARIAELEKSEAAAHAHADEWKQVNKYQESRIAELESKLAEQARELADAKYEAWTRECDDLRSNLAALESAKGGVDLVEKNLEMAAKSAESEAGLYAAILQTHAAIRALRESEVKP